MQHHHIVGRFTDRVMKGNVQPAFGRQVLAVMRFLHLADNVLQPGKVGWGGPCGCKGCRLALDAPPEFEIVVYRARVPGNQLHHCFGKIGPISSAT